MDSSTILAILGISATVVLGGFSIYLVLWTRKYPGRVTFVKETCIGLFDSLVRNLPDLSINYNDQPIGENLVFLKGYLLNTGVKDITPDMIAERIAIALPEGYRWMTGQVVSASAGVDAAIDLTDDRKMVFNVSLFRRNENFRFEALAEVPIGEADNPKTRVTADQLLEREMTFQHRIADTQSIDQQEIQTESQMKRHRRLMWISVFQIVLLLATGTVIGIMEWRTHHGLPAEIRYELNQDSTSSIEVTLAPSLDGTVTVKGVDDEFRETMPIATFFDEREWKPIVVNKRGTLAMLIVIPATIFLFAIPLLYVIRLRQRDKNLKRLLSVNETEELEHAEEG